MAQELTIKLKPQKEELLKYTKTYGKYKAMRKFDIKTIPAMDRLLMEWTGNANFGINPEMQPGIRQSVGDQLLDAIVSAMDNFKAKISDLQDRNKRICEECKRLREENEFLKEQLNQTYHEDDIEADIDRILKSCNDKVSV
jgi:septal ring factor EnvC (AmiA/AmiB activator)